MGKVAIVIDNGSCFTRAGFAGEDKPKSVLKTTSMPLTAPAVMRETPCHLTAIGCGTGSARASKTHPLRHGIITDWEAMENLWNHLFFCGLRTSPVERPLLMTDSPSCPTTNREKVAEVFFEAFGVPALHVANTGLLSLCSCGRVTGLAVEAGAGVSHVTSICGGQIWRKATYRLDVAGFSLSKHMHTLLMKSSNDPQLLCTLQKTTVTQLKKQCCYVSMDYEGDLQDKAHQFPMGFKTPDGHWITLDKERFCCPEPLFQPKLLDQNSPGIHLLAFQSLQKVPDECKGDIIGNTVLSGGSSMFPGFPERMCSELDALLYGKGYRIKILAAPKRSIAVWAGGSMAASLKCFRHMWMTKGEYQEYGAAYVHKKFN
ncbi:actin-like protein 10 [Chrysemys picta bellii]|uniref:actin-like protein 10 n=1 Tax=Chrysemys picta bellii TaxID=8478 RepID=UPI0032B2DF78